MHKHKQHVLLVLVCTVFALIAFAANSVLCRMALKGMSIDAASFSSIRVASGAVMLVLIHKLSSGQITTQMRGNWLSAIALFAYMVTFSFAYISLSTGTGALILFGMVQTTMIFWALKSGERPHFTEWTGFLFALTGLVYLVSPGLQAPSLTGSLLMIIAGISWGIYSLQGRNTTNPLADTTGNFVRAMPLIIMVNLFTLQHSHISMTGVLFAVISGALASGLGYAVWYIALQSLTTSRAAIVQLSVPVLAAFAGIIFLAEDISIRLLISTLLILGGIALSTLSRKKMHRLTDAA